MAKHLERWVLWADWTMPKNLALLVSKKSNWWLEGMSRLGSSHLVM